jgi:hypothetical protein
MRIDSQGGKLDSYNFPSIEIELATEIQVIDYSVYGTVFASLAKPVPMIWII